VGLFDFLKKEDSSQASSYGFKSILSEKQRKKANIRVITYDENGKEIKDDSAFDKNAKPMQYYEKIRNEIKPIENIIVGFAVALKRPQRVDDEILLLKSLIENYKDLKTKCYALGPDYVEYFNASWEQVLKGKPEGPSYVARYYTRLKYIKDNYSELKKQEAIHEKESKDLETRLVSLLKKTNGILQTDIYKQFHPAVKSDIQSILYSMEKQGRINRKKSGRTYAIYYVK